MVSKDKAMVEIFWRAYQTLKPEERRELAERMLRDDKKVMEDAIDYMLIEKAKGIKGKPVTLKEYEARQKVAR